MAKTPSDPNDPPAAGRDQTTPDPKPRPGSLADSDWFAAIPELPVPDPNRASVIPTDADLDLDSIFSVTPEAPAPAATPERVAPASGWLTPADRGRPATPAAPSGDADGEGSDIFSTGGRRPRGGSDAFRLDDPREADRPRVASGHSNIFDEPAGESGDLAHFFKGSADSADPPEAGGTTSLDGLAVGGDRLDDDLFLAFDQPPSELFDAPGPHDDGSDAVNDLMDELHLPFAAPPGGPRGARPGSGGRGNPQGPITPGTGIDFNETAADASSSNLFADLTEPDGQSLNSGVNLLNPDGDLPRAPRRPTPTAGPDSSIFPKRPQGSSLVNMDQIPLMGSSDEPTEALAYTGPDVDGTSSIFQRGDHPAPPGAGSDAAGGDRSSVSFGSPSRHGRIVSLGAGQSGATSDDASAAIDWSLPAELPAPRRPGAPAGKSPAVRPPGDSEADLTGLDDGAGPTARMAPSSGIFDVDTSRETPLGSLSGFYPSGASQGPKSGFLTPPPSGLRLPAGGQLPPRSNARLTPPRPATPATKSALKPPAPAAKSGRGWGGGLALGLGVGVLSTAALAAIGLALAGPQLGSGTPAPAPVTLTQPLSGDAALAQARQWLDEGKPELALAAFEAAGDDASPIDVAGRGQARWLIRVRQAALNNETLRADDAGLKPALADLDRTVAAGDLLKFGEQRRALLGAVLRLGLTKELTGDPAGAVADYDAAAAKYPDARKLFEVAAARTRLMRASGKVALAPRDVDGLLGVALAAVLLVQDDGRASEVGVAEPGLLFWEAANQAAARDYPAAIATIKEARALHDRNRLAKAGRGLNPLTDPVEQIFLKCCDELAADWTLRQQLYTDPVAGPVFARSGVAAGLKQLAAAAKPDPKVAAQLRVTRENLAASKAELAKATAKATEADEKLTATAAEAAASATAAKTAKDKLAAAEAKARVADDAVAKLVSGLKAGKVVGPDDDAATVLKNLPDLLKKVTSASDSADAKKAAEALAAARTEAAAARADATATATKLAAVEAERKKELDAATLALKVQLSEQKAAHDAKLDALSREAKRRDDDARAQIANARAGVAVPLMTSESAGQAQAVGLYTRAINSYFDGRVAEAEASLAKAVEQDPADARYWYFLGLARLAQDKPSAAAAFRRGAEFEARGLPRVNEINAALEKVQGNARQALNGYRR